MDFEPTKGRLGVECHCRFPALRHGTQRDCGLLAAQFGSNPHDRPECNDESFLRLHEGSARADLRDTQSECTVCSIDNLLEPLRKRETGSEGWGSSGRRSQLRLGMPEQISKEVKIFVHSPSSPGGPPDVLRTYIEFRLVLGLHYDVCVSSLQL